MESEKAQDKNIVCRPWLSFLGGSWTAFDE